MEHKQEMFSRNVAYFTIEVNGDWGLTFKIEGSKHIKTVDVIDNH